jgi:hypothetical protein
MMRNENGGKHKGTALTFTHMVLSVVIDPVVGRH